MYEVEEVGCYALEIETQKNCICRYLKFEKRTRKQKLSSSF